MEKETYGNMVAALRKKKGMTQLELAEKMGVTDKAVSKWERDLSFPDVNTIPKLAEIFNVTVDELIQAKSKEKEITAKSIELYFDKETEKKLNHLAQKIADKHISTKFLEWKSRPHLTLACFNDVDKYHCIEKLKDFASTHKTLPAYISSIGMFNDTKFNSQGTPITLYEGMPISIYEESVYEDGEFEYLIAEGTVIKHDLNKYPCFPYVKWLCRIDANGIQNRPKLQTLEKSTRTE